MLCEVPRFAVDAMLGKMAKWLRFMGFDTLYVYVRYPHEVRRLVSEGRVFVTRNRRWQGMKGVIVISANDLDDQIVELAEVLDFALPDDDEWFSRCGRCNAVLEQVDRRSVTGMVPEYVWETTEEFFRCPTCGKVYWPGSHVERMQGKLESLKRALAEKGGRDYGGSF
ncbi:Mut7-C RNAse domain-containing protein [Thermodesulforhabdus norvegica]|uniref:Mut7-C RNAse domain-containing protein n=1 Tax=Thermodesulforhabdus norvegica TaxID=39841 RepID=A0A1I4QP40_9BACT|nr:Mut7-C RNAse domain-containing protein [Thermodesulforhabdus norvegica]SFM41852.1 hypothetical protein SAMN05660836_00146 [Thermodesulforhabdus norvegica]